MKGRAVQEETKTECSQLSHLDPERAVPLPRVTQPGTSEQGRTLDSAFMFPWHQAASPHDGEVMLPLRWEAWNHGTLSPPKAKALQPGLTLHSSHGVSERMTALIGLVALPFTFPALPTTQPALGILVTSIPRPQERGVHG